MAKFNTFKYGSGEKYGVITYVSKIAAVTIVKSAKSILRVVGEEISLATSKYGSGVYGALVYNAPPSNSVLKTGIKKTILKTKGEQTIL